MLLIDRLCYTSGLRHMNAGEKCVLSLFSIVLCVGTRSAAAAAAVFLAMAFLCIKKGGVPAGLYLRLLLIPLAFVLLGTAAVLVNLSRTPLDAFALPAETDVQKAAKIATVKQLYITLGVDRDAKDEVLHFTARAMDAVSGSGLNAGQLETLHDFADKLVGRAR